MEQSKLHPTFKQVLRKASFWIWIPLFLWLTQVWAVWASEFPMEFTLLQFPLVLAFQVFIYLIAQERLMDAWENDALEIQSLDECATEPDST